jgi:hypothetical protein
MHCAQVHHNPPQRTWVTMKLQDYVELDLCPQQNFEPRFHIEYDFDRILSNSKCYKIKQSTTSKNIFFI